tara:strand:- start:38 stop:421 length:384 start_codon:yes stop_codon:yes gene_type:complete
LRTFVASLIFGLLIVNPSPAFAQETIFAASSCTIIYSLKRSANKYFNDEISQLKAQIDKQNIHFIDLNNWNKMSPHVEVSGRLRNQIRQQYDLASNINQAIVVNKQGLILSHYSGSVTLVNALIDCY